jgi:hypothetical protein
MILIASVMAYCVLLWLVMADRRRRIADLRGALAMDTEGDEGWEMWLTLSTPASATYSALYFIGIVTAVTFAGFVGVPLVAVMFVAVPLIVFKLGLGPFKAVALVDRGRTYIAHRGWLGGPGKVIVDERPRAGWFELASGLRVALTYHAASGDGIRFVWSRFRSRAATDLVERFSIPPVEWTPGSSHEQPR